MDPSLQKSQFLELIKETGQDIRERSPAITSETKHPSSWFCCFQGIQQLLASPIVCTPNISKLSRTEICTGLKPLLEKRSDVLEPIAVSDHSGRDYGILCPRQNNCDVFYERLIRLIMHENAIQANHARPFYIFIMNQITSIAKVYLIEGCAQLQNHWPRRR